MTLCRRHGCRGRERERKLRRTAKGVKGGAEKRSRTVKVCTLRGLTRAGDARVYKRGNCPADRTGRKLQRFRPIARARTRGANSISRAASDSRIDARRRACVFNVNARAVRHQKMRDRPRAGFVFTVSISRAIRSLRVLLLCFRDFFPFLFVPVVFFLRRKFIRQRVWRRVMSCLEEKQREGGLAS